MKIAAIVGARPQFIKAAVVSRAIREHNRTGRPAVEETIIHTGQHFDSNMSEVFFDEMQIPEPKVNLGINSLRHGEMTGRMLEKIEQVLQDERPDWVLVYGDTNTTLAGAVTAKKLHIKLAHVEAGLRSFNMAMPEEQNRLVADRLANLLLCPTQTAVENLKDEGVGGSRYGETVINVGDVMYDAALFYAELAEKKSRVLEELHLATDSFALATVHRAENTDDFNRLHHIFEALNEIARKCQVVLPLHPRTRKILDGQHIETQHICITSPVSYLGMVLLEKNCSLILTDSGGVQKEAYFFEKPCLTLRDETEWVELVDAGVNLIVGADRQRIVDAFQATKNRRFDFSIPFYGDGQAGHRIVQALIDY